MGIVDIITLWMRRVCVILFLILMITTALDVISRPISGSSLVWSQQAAVWTNMFLIFLFAPVMVMDDTHIRVTFLRDRLKGLPRTIIVQINRLALIVFCVLATLGTWEYMLFLFTRNTLRNFGTWQIPYFIIILVLPIGFGLLGLAATYLFVQQLRGKGQPAKKSEE